MKSLQNKFGRLKVDYARITILEKDLVPEVEKIKKLNFLKCIEQEKSDIVYFMSSTRGVLRARPKAT